SGLSKEADSLGAWRDAVLALQNAAWMRNGTIDDDLRFGLMASIHRVGLNLDRGAEFVPCVALPRCHVDWFSDVRLRGACNHETRTHIRDDLHRYLFCAVFARERGRSP